MSSLATTPEVDSSLSSQQDEAQHWTFRDPAGQLHLTAHSAVRRIHSSAEEETRIFLASSLRHKLERSGDLISTEIASNILHPAMRPGELWLQHPRIDPISYPWEWTTAQWRSAAELTLRIADQAIDAGWMLKDATPWNILFTGTRPILVDVLSIERRNPNASVWLAYGQFVRTFLLPLVAEKYLHWPLQATLFARDGYEPRALYQALRFWQRLNPDLLDVVTLAALFESSGNATAKPRSMPTTSDPALAAHILHKRIARLRKQIQHSARSTRSTQWSSYQQAASHYSQADTETKQSFVRNLFQQHRPARVLDIGANTGIYSTMAAETGAQVVALDSDQAAVEALWRTASQQGHAITALVVNIARPTPATGWRNQEQLSLLDRLTGRFDMVLMLAVIHHLILQEQLPLAHIADLCASLTSRYLLIEWVPPSDPMYQAWLRGRDHLYGHLSEDNLQRAFAPHFHRIDRKELGNRRVLLLYERNSASAPAFNPSRNASPA